MRAERVLGELDGVLTRLRKTIMLAGVTLGTLVAARIVIAAWGRPSAKVGGGAAPAA